MKLVTDYELQALLLLSSFPNSWETLVVSLSNSTPNGVLQLAVVKDSLLNEETRRKDMGKDIAHALVIEKGREVRVEVLKGEVNPEVSQNQKENSSAFTVIKKVT